MKNGRSITPKERTLLRKAKTQSQSRFGIGGIERKERNKPKPVSVASVNLFLSDDDQKETTK